MAEGTKMGLVPHGDRIVIRLPEPEKKTAGGIIIPESAQENSKDQRKAVGVVDAFGPDVQDKMIQLDAKVVYEHEGGIPLTIDGKKYLVINESAIIGVMVEKSK